MNRQHYAARLTRPDSPVPTAKLLAALAGCWLVMMIIIATELFA
jgi:uncharacterized OsmC-like protein